MNISKWPNKNGKIFKLPTVIVKYVWKINKNQQQTNDEQPWNNENIVRYTMKHINPENWSNTNWTFFIFIHSQIVWDCAAMHTPSFHETAILYTLHRLVVGKKWCGKGDCAPMCQCLGPRSGTYGKPLRLSGRGHKLNSAWKHGNTMNISEEKTMNTLKFKQLKAFNKTM